MLRKGPVTGFLKRKNSPESVIILKPCFLKAGLLVFTQPAAFPTHSCRKPLQKQPFGQYFYLLFIRIYPLSDALFPVRLSVVYKALITQAGIKQVVSDPGMILYKLMFILLFDSELTNIVLFVRYLYKQVVNLCTLT
jgi:hypothetical protein